MSTLELLALGSFCRCGLSLTFSLLPQSRHSNKLYSKYLTKQQKCMLSQTGPASAAALTPLQDRRLEGSWDRERGSKYWSWWTLYLNLSSIYRSSSPLWTIISSAWWSQEGPPVAPALTTRGSQNLFRLLSISVYDFILCVALLFLTSFTPISLLYLLSISSQAPTQFGFNDTLPLSYSTFSIKCCLAFFPLSSCLCFHHPLTLLFSLHSVEVSVCRIHM